MSRAVTFDALPDDIVRVIDDCQGLARALFRAATIITRIAAVRRVQLSYGVVVCT